MNKTLRLVLVLSLVANAVWLLGSFGGYFSVSRATSFAPTASGGKGGETGKLSPEATKELAALFSTNDLVSLRDKLKAAGLPEDVVRSVISSRIWSRYSARQREINKAAMEAAAQRPYWQGSSNRMFSYTNYSREQMRELQEMSREAQAEARKVLGDDPYSSSPMMNRYAFLPSEKASQLRAMESDYSDLRMQTLQEMEGFRMPSDAAKLKLLDEEKERDMLALLTPEEREANNLRNSETASQLKRELAGFKMSENEYKTIYSLQSALDEKYPINSMAAYAGGADISDMYRARSEAQKDIEAQIKETLGAERYTEYELSKRQDYQTLQAAAQRFNLAPETVAQTYQARTDAANEAKRIDDDKNLSAEQRTQAYAAIAEQATSQIRAALGDEVGDAYINNALGWLKNLPAGGRVYIDPRGNVRHIPPRPPTPRPTAPAR